MGGIKPVFKLPIYRQNPTTSKLETTEYIVRPARNTKSEIRTITELYNDRLDPKHERGLAVKSEQIESRLNFDPESILVGFIRGEMVSLINIIKLNIDKLSLIPSSYQALTGDDSWSTTDRRGTLWICPWVTVHPLLARAWKGEVKGRFKSLAQLQVLAVQAAAQEREIELRGMVAYSRPAGLVHYLQKKWSTQFEFSGPGHLMFLDYGYVRTDRDGLFVNGPMSVPVRLFYLKEYLAHLDAGKRVADRVLRMHIENGALINPNLIFPRGNVNDYSSIFYRIGLVYKTA
jgi:hypothetical protein